jgi:hypothetical protein
MMTAFRVILLFCLALAFIGNVAGGKEDQRNCRPLFTISGVLFILSFLV